MASSSNQKAPSNGSQVHTEAAPATLSLRLVPPSNDQHVTWKDDVVDNEHLNKKKSKKCCIFHKQKDPEDESTDSDSDWECDCLPYECIHRT